MFLDKKRVVALLQYPFPLFDRSGSGYRRIDFRVRPNKGLATSACSSPSVAMQKPLQLGRGRRDGREVLHTTRYHAIIIWSQSPGFEISAPDQKVNIYCAGIAIKIFEYIFTVILASIYLSIYLLPTNLLLHRDLSSTKSRILVID